MLIIVFGLPGTGKTFFASALAQALKCRHLNTDVLRKKVAKEMDYSEEGRMKIYERMLALSEEALNKKEDLILDGTFLKKELRDKFEKKGLEYNERVCFIEIKAEEGEVLNRVSKKRENTDAGVEVYLKLKEELDLMDKRHLILWSDKMDLQDMIKEAKVFLRKP